MKDDLRLAKPKAKHDDKNWNPYSRMSDIIGSILIPDGYVVEVSMLSSHKFVVHFKRDLGKKGAGA